MLDSYYLVRNNKFVVFQIIDLRIFLYGMKICNVTKYEVVIPRNKTLSKSGTYSYDPNIVGFQELEPLKASDLDFFLAWSTLLECVLSWSNLFDSVCRRYYIKSKRKETFQKISFFYIIAFRV